MIYVRPTSPHTFRHCGGPNACKVFFKACNNDDAEKKCQSQAKPKDTSKSSNDGGRVFVERAPIHFDDTDEFAKLALDVAGFSPEDIQVKMEDFIVSIEGKRTNKLGDTYVISRRFRVDRKTVLEDEVRASLTEGILEILVPKKAKVGPRSIPITTARPVLKPTLTEGASEHDEASDDKDETAESVEDKSEASVDVETVEYDEDDDEEEAKPESNNTEVVTEEESWEEVKE